MENVNSPIKISVIVPVFNEKGAVLDTVNSLKRVLDNARVKYQIIAINDKSTDGSEKILEKINFDNFSAINHSFNRGYGASLKTGIKQSHYDWILIIDADGTYPTEIIPSMIEKTKESDMVIGSREKKENSIPQERKLAKIFLNKFAGYIAGKKIPDLNSGLRIFRKDLVLKHWELFPDRFSFTSTLTMLCLTHGYKAIFIPIDYHKRKGKSSIKPTDFFTFVKLIAKLSLFFRPIKIFGLTSAIIAFSALALPIMFFTGMTTKFFDTTFIVLFATALQTLFFGLLAEIIIHNK